MKKKEKEEKKQQEEAQKEEKRKEREMKRQQVDAEKEQRKQAREAAEKKQQLVLLKQASMMKRLDWVLPILWFFLGSGCLSTEFQELSCGMKSDHCVDLLVSMFTSS